MPRYRLYKPETERIGRRYFSKIESHEYAQIAKGIEEKIGRPSRAIVDAMMKKDYMFLGETAILYSTECEMEDNGKYDLEIVNIMFLENNHIVMGSRTIFIQDQDLLCALYESKMDVSFESIVSGGNMSFSVSLQDVVIDDLDVQPFLFSVSDDAESDGKLISVSANEGSTRCASLGAKEYAEFMPSFPRVKKEGDTSLSVYLKLAASITAYMKAFPECVMNKFPADMSAVEMAHVRKFYSGNHATITSPKNSTTGASIHLRRGHFRSLHNKRFKRNQDGSIKIVWVKDTVVGGKIDPYTVESIL